MNKGAPFWALLGPPFARLVPTTYARLAIYSLPPTQDSPHFACPASRAGSTEGIQVPAAGLSSATERNVQGRTSSETGPGMERAFLLRTQARCQPDTSQQALRNRMSV